MSEDLDELENISIQTSRKVNKQPNRKIVLPKFKRSINSISNSGRHKNKITLAGGKMKIEALK